MVVANHISEQEYRELALNDPDHLWELWDGVPREKPLMSMKHEDVSFLLGHILQGQLDWAATESMSTVAGPELAPQPTSSRTSWSFRRPSAAI